MRQFVDVGGLNPAAAITEIGIAEIVGHDENNVRPLCIAPRHQREAETAEQGRTNNQRSLDHSFLRCLA